MAKSLDRRREDEIGQEILDGFGESNYTAEEVIPGLIKAIFKIAVQLPDPMQGIDEAVDLLVDGPDA